MKWCRACRRRKAQADRRWLCDPCSRDPNVRPYYRPRKGPQQTRKQPLPDRPAEKPTDTLPGTADRIQVYKERYWNHEGLYHPGDRKAAGLTAQVERLLAEAMAQGGTDEERAESEG